MGQMLVDPHTMSAEMKSGSEVSLRFDPWPNGPGAWPIPGRSKAHQRSLRSNGFRKERVSRERLVDPLAGQPVSQGPVLRP